MAHVFISHASADKVTVERNIVEPLAANGVNTWYSSAEIRSASDWEKCIRSGLSECNWFLVTLTPMSVISRWVRAEVDWAFENRESHVVPVLLEDCDWKQLHLLIRSVQMIDLTADPPSGIRQLVSLFGASFYRAMQAVRAREDALSPAEVDLRNGQWDLFSAHIATLPPADRMKHQIRSNEHALAKQQLRVSELKRQLHVLGYFDGVIDEQLTPELIQGVELLQRRCNLRHVDGVFGELTYLAMEEMATRRGLL